MLMFCLQLLKALPYSIRENNCYSFSINEILLYLLFSHLEYIFNSIRHIMITVIFDSYTIKTNNLNICINFQIISMECNDLPVMNGAHHVMPLFLPFTLFFIDHLHLYVISTDISHAEAMHTSFSQY